VFLGANTGVFSAINLDTGTQIWDRFLGFTPPLTCAARGITATASVAPDPTSGAATVYAAGGDGYLYALAAADGTVRWRSAVGSLPSATANDYYTWSSPTVDGDRVYIGVSSQCDKPLVQGGLLAFNRSTGAIAASYWVVPDGEIGGGIWSSPVVAGGHVFVTTGNAPQNSGDSNSLVRLDAATLARQESWQVPPADQTTDSDFGASPTVFEATLQGVATTMVGACNKNGVFYALRANDLAAGPVWTLRVGESTSSAGCSSAGMRPALAAGRSRDR
jgi:polyvinyl alcohol dehydrogenase (cytochrome)